MRCRPWTAIIIGGAVIAAAAGGLAGCRLSQHAAALPHASCGSAVTHGLNESTRALSADPGALACFNAAARDCKAAGIEITEMGIDTGTSFVFSISPRPTTCQATELSQDYSANFGGSTGPVTTVPCRLAAVSGEGVTLGCGGQAVLIPSAVIRGDHATSANTGRCACGSAQNIHSGYAKRQGLLVLGQASAGTPTPLTAGD